MSAGDEESAAVLVIDRGSRRRGAVIPIDGCGEIALDRRRTGIGEGSDIADERRAFDRRIHRSRDGDRIVVDRRGGAGHLAVSGTGNSDRERLASELAILAKLGNHPNILPFIVACLTQSDHAYLVFRFCEHGSLYEYLLVQKRLITPSQLQQTLHESAAALEYLHSEDVVHRDIAARNYLLAEEAAQGLMRIHHGEY